jgi:hypothetical protein
MTLTAVPKPTGEGSDSGESLLNDVFDLIAERLPQLPLDDPTRPALAATLPLLGAGLGRPRAMLVGGDA